MRQLHVAVVGLGFGAAFGPIYLAHPGVRRLTVCDPNPAALQSFLDEEGPLAGDRLKVAASLDEILFDPSVDAVHLLTPLPLHAEQILKVLRAGKHCATAVTMASSLDALDEIVRAADHAGKNLMMMETAVFTREFLAAKDLRDGGKLGPITFLQADYFQDLEAPYPDYWRTVPPMHYATHATAPLLALAETTAERVSCIGAGRMRTDISDLPSNPFPMQVAHFRLKDNPAVAQMNRAWYQAARQYVESFSVLGEKMGFEWQQLQNEDPVFFELEPVQSEVRWRGCKSERRPVPYRSDLLPDELHSFAEGGHGGSHPHLVHSFISSITEGRKPTYDHRTAANWCAAGICAHESSLQDGQWVAVPTF